MGQIRHGCATTTHAILAAIQRSQASNRELGIYVKTVAKWRKRQTVEDRQKGPKEPSSTVLSEEEEAAIVAFRRHGDVRQTNSSIRYLESEDSMRREESATQHKQHRCRPS